MRALAVCLVIASSLLARAALACPPPPPGEVCSKYRNLPELRVEEKVDGSIYTLHACRIGKRGTACLVLEPSAE